jgi:hypothetical protein
MKLTKENVQTITQFAKHCIRELGIKSPVKITLSKRQTGQATAGYYNPADCTVFVAVHNRAIADIMRTVAHELTHCKQQEDGTEFPSDDEGLQPLENEANEKSGILVRFYGRKHPEIYADLSCTYLQEFLFPNANNRKIIAS